MKIIDKWNEYVGPKDERIVAEENRAYRVAGLAIAFGVIALTYYQNALITAAFMGDADESVALIAMPLACMWVCIVLVACAINFARKGIIDNNRFAGVERYPMGYFSLLSALAGVGGTVAIFLINVIAQTQVLGFAEVMWSGDAAIAVMLGVSIFILCMVAFPIFFHSAKKNRDKDLDPGE